MTFLRLSKALQRQEFYICRLCMPSDAVREYRKDFPPCSTMVRGKAFAQRSTKEAVARSVGCMNILIERVHIFGFLCRIACPHMRN